tara:strand:+ start:9798 stop:11606 length:1809 start_codon:yes stop_codon:yes gene_type:complete
MKNIFQFIKENETRNEDDVTQEEFIEALLEIEEELDEFELEESVELDEKAPKIKGDWLKQERERNNKHDAAMGRTKTGRKKPTRTMTSTQKSLASMREESLELDEAAMKGNYAKVIYDYKEDYYFIRVYKNGKQVSEDDGYFGANEKGNPLIKKFTDLVKKAKLNPEGMPIVNDDGKKGVFKANKFNWNVKESVELNELSAEEKKLINTMYDKKGNLTPMGKKVMDHGKKNAVKESVELDEASEEGKIRVIDLSDAHPDNRMGAKEKSGYQVQRMTKGKFVNQGKPYKKYADAKKVQQGTGQHSMQFEEKSGTGYELYHKDFSGAMGHAYAHAKKKFNITVDSDEIDDKVAMGPRKPGNGKTNTYRLKGDKGNIQVQVYNRGGSKPFELNMYKESVELDESKWEYQDARGVTKTGSLSKTVERQGTDVSYIFKGDDGKTDVVSGSRLKKMKKIKESVIDEAKTPELKGNPFKYYKKPTNKKEAQSNVNFWHYVGMADNDEIEDMGKIPANYKSYAKSMKQDAQRELKKMNEAVVLDEASLIPQLQTIVKDKQHAKIKGMIVDTFTASMITQIYSKVNDANKAKMDKLPLEKLVNIAHKMMKK